MDRHLDPNIIRQHTARQWIERLWRMERSCIAELTTTEAGELARVLEGETAVCRECASRHATPRSRS